MSIENGSGSGQMNCRGLFAANKSHSLRFFPPPLKDGEVKIKPPSEVFDAGIMVWGNSLVAQFLGRSLFLADMAEQLGTGKSGRKQKSKKSNAFIETIPDNEKTETAFTTTALLRLLP
ncbi:hypothetical protein V6N13_130488 [Hibiscus sabdariffa]|uniref:Uncharacterized protein n=1 Tax=Hibiscus sabdariffa TaxID=183260 RepID=A0ABR2B6L8_9ROSI